MIAMATCLLFLVMLLRLRRTYGFALLVALEWLVLLAVYLAIQHKFVPLSATTDLLLATLLASLLLGLVAATAAGDSARLRPRFHVMPGAFYLVSFIAILVTLALVVRFDWRYVASLAALRTLFTDAGGEASPTFGVGLSFPLAMAAVMLARANGHVWRGRFFALAGALLALLTTSKIFLLLLVLYLLPVDLDWRSIRLAVLSRYVLVALGLVVALHLLLGKVVETGETGLFGAMSLTLVSYVGNGLAGFEVLVDGLVEFPANAIWSQVGSLFPGVIRVPDLRILPWVQVGSWNTNTYTAFAYWLDGLGLVGAVAFAALVGWVGGRLLRLQTLGGRFIVRFYVFCIIFLFHQDFFLSAVGMWSIYIGIALLLWPAEPLTEESPGFVVRRPATRVRGQ